MKFLFFYGRQHGKVTETASKLAERLAEAEAILVQVDDFTAKEIIPMNTASMKARMYLRKYYGEKE